MKKRTRVFLIIGGALVVVVFVILAIVQNQEKLIPVTVEEVFQGEIISIVTANGTVEAEKNVNISSDIMGRIIELPIVEGQYVNKGDLLVQIETTQSQADVSQMQALLASTKVSEEETKISFEREKKLFEKGHCSEADYDLARLEYDLAKTEIQQAEANLERALDELDKCTIRAPMAGTITTLNSEEGEIVIVGTMNNQGTVIMVISDLSKIVVKVDVDETDIAHLKLDQDVEIALDAFPDTTFKGMVTEIGNSAIVTGSSSEQVTNFEVTVLITDTVPGIKPGMNATVDITTDTRDDVIKIPIQAVVMRNPNEGKDEKPGDDPSGETASEESKNKDKNDKNEDEEIEGVFVINDKEAHFVPVETGIADQQYIEITSGLEVGAKVITGSYKTLRSLKDGDKVKATEKKFDEFGS